MHFMDSSLEDTDFTTKDILNFLHNDPEEQRAAGMPNFDWRNVFNITDQIIRMFNQYGEVSQTRLRRFAWLCFPSLSRSLSSNSHAFPGLWFQPFFCETDSRILSPPDRSISLLGLFSPRRLQPGPLSNVAGHLAQLIELLSHTVG